MTFASRSTRFVVSALAVLVLGAVIIGVASLSAHDAQVGLLPPLSTNDTQTHTTLTGQTPSHLRRP